MSDMGSDQTVQFSFCPKCGTTLNKGQCAKCGWSPAPAVIHATPPRKRRRFELLIAALTLLILLSVGLNTILNFGSVVGWLPTGVLLWMDGDGKGQASTELAQRFRQDKLSKNQLAKLVEKRLMDSTLHVQSPYPAGVEQALQIEHNCRLPGGEVDVLLEDWKLLVDGDAVAAAPPTQIPEAVPGLPDDIPIPNNARVLRTRNERMQKINLPSLEAGTHKIELTGRLAAKRGIENPEIIYSRLASLTKDVEIKGVLRDYIRARTGSSVLNVVRDHCGAHSFWTGNEDEDENRKYTLQIGLALPEVPFIMSVWARVGKKGEFTQIGSFDAEKSPRTIARNRDFSLADVPGIAEAKRIQVQLRPDLEKAIAGGHKECFGGIVEWDAIPLSHRRSGYRFNPYTDEVRPPSRVQKPDGKKKELPQREAEEEL